MKKFLRELGRNKASRLRKCKPYIMAFCALFALFTLLGSTLAWFTTADTKVNSLETPPDKHFLVQAVDVFDKTPDGHGIYAKRVGTANVSEKPGFVRLLVMASFMLDPAVPGDPPTLLPATIGGEGSGAMVIMTDFNAGGHWIDATDLGAGGDGYYYYTHILAPGRSTDVTDLNQNLFNTVRLAEGLPPEYEGARLMIEVKCEAVATRPADEYIKSWWDSDGNAPKSGDGVLYEIHTALQMALGL